MTARPGKENYQRISVTTDCSQGREEKKTKEEQEQKEKKMKRREKSTREQDGSRHSH
jgi:ribosome assembly protein YihI (activator of Der GTPase)